jgi:predicted PurR-regulated permease PerM
MDSDETDNTSQLEPGVKLAIYTIAIGVLVTFLYLASAILIPIVLAFFLSYVLYPLVQGLMRLRLPGTDLTMPREVSAGIVVLFAVGFGIFITVLMSYQVRHLGGEIPKYRDQIAKQVGEVRDSLLQARERFENYLRPLRRKSEGQEKSIPSPDQTTGENDSKERTSELVEQFGKQLEKAGLFVDSNRQLWWQASSFVAGRLAGILGFLLQVMTSIFVLYIALVEAPYIKQKVIDTIGTNEHRQQRTLAFLEKIHDDIQRYLLGRFAINAVLAAVTTLVFYIYGLNYALLVGIVAGLFNFIPYVGPALGMFFPALIAFMQFGNWEAIATTVFIYILLTGTEGNLITPIVLGRHLQLNSFVVLLSFIFWGWLWGAAGMILTLPIMAVIRAVSEYVDELTPVYQLLRGRE